MPDTESQQNKILESSLDVVGEAVHSALYSGLQQPYEGVSQLVNHVTSRHLLPNLTLVDAPKEAKFGSLDWHAQQIGGAMGMAVPFLVLNAGMRELGSPLMAAASESTGLRLATTVALGGTSGALYEGLFTPVAGDGKDFWAQRAKNAAVGGITFAAMSGVQGGLETFRAAGVNPEYRFLTQKLGTRLVDGALSGTIAGAVNAEASSVADGKGAADWKSVAKSAYGYAFIGAATGAYGHFADARQQTSDNFLSNKYGNTWPGDSRLQIRSELLNHLVESETTKAPQKLSSYLDFLQADDLGIKANPYDVGVWEGQERAALLQEIRRRAESPVGDEANLDRNIRTLSEATRDWNGKDLEPIHDFLTQAEQKSAAAKAERMRIAHQDPVLAGMDETSLLTDKQLIESHPTYKEALRKEFEAAAEVATAEHYLDNEYQGRKDSVDEALNKIARDLGLPLINFDIHSDKKFGGQYNNGHGKLSVDREFLRGETLKTQSLDVLLHEFTHFEQDILVIRRLADGLDIPKTANFEQRGQLAKAYEIFTDDVPSTDFLERVLEQRDGRRLNSDQVHRADELLDSFRFYSREGYSKGDFKEADLLDRLRSIIKQTSTDEGLGQLRNQVSVDANLAQLLLGNAQTSEAPALASHSMFGQFYDRDSASSLIRSKAAELLPAAKQRYSGYIGSKLETDAWSVGLLTQIKARSLGIKGFEWQDMKPDYGSLPKPVGDPIRPPVLSNVGEVQTFEQWLDSASLDFIQRFRRNIGVDIKPFDKKLNDLQK